MTQPRPLADPDTERTVLACALLNTEAAIRICATCAAEWFTDRTNREIFGAIEQVIAGGQRPDRVKILRLIPDNAHARSALLGLGDLFPILEDLNAYIGIIQDAQRRRTLQKVFTNAARDLAGDADTEAITQRAVTAIMSTDRVTEDGDVVAHLMRERARLRDHAQDPDQEPMWPWPAWAEALPIHSTGQITVIGATTSGLKSQVCLQAVNEMARHGHRCIYFTLELPLIELYRRIASFEMGWDLKLRPDQNWPQWPLKPVGDDELQRWAEARRADVPLFIEDRTFSVAEIRLAVMKHKLAGPVRLVVVDYLTNLSFPPNKDQNSALAGALLEFQIMGKELQTDFILVSQLNRQADGSKPSETPKRSWLRGSGEIEERADQIIIGRETDKGQGEGWGIDYHWLKDRRHGQYGRKVPLYWDARERRLRAAEYDG